MKNIKNFEEFNEGKFSNFVKAGIASAMMFSCNDITLKTKDGTEIESPASYTTTGIIKDMTSVQLGSGGGQVQYTFVIDDEHGNEIVIHKISTFSFDSETPSFWGFSNLDEGDRVSIECNGDDCELTKIE